MTLSRWHLNIHRSEHDWFVYKKKHIPNLKIHLPTTIWLNLHQVISYLVPLKQNHHFRGTNFSLILISPQKREPKCLRPQVQGVPSPKTNSKFTLKINCLEDELSFWTFLLGGKKGLFSGVNSLTGWPGGIIFPIKNGCFWWTLRWILPTLRYQLWSTFECLGHQKR